MLLAGALEFETFEVVLIIFSSPCVWAWAPCGYSRVRGLTSLKLPASSPHPTDEAESQTHENN